MHAIRLVFLLVTGLFFSTSAQDIIISPPTDDHHWPSGLPWWKRNNLRVMQCNLPAYEGSLDVDHLIEDLLRFSVNTLIINGGGIMAFYPTTLDFQYTNPYMHPLMLSEVISQCHEHGIKVVTRFDFSRFHKSIFQEHPDWAYISPEGDRIINDDMYVASINAPYVQEKSVAIVEELIRKYPVDGIFINMPGYSTRNVYEGIYHGVDQNIHDQKRFADYSGGLALPLAENPADSVYQKYQEFKKYTADEWMGEIHAVVKKQNPNIAICTYQEKFVDIIRHESQTNTLPYWPYMSFDNVTNIRCSQPDHIVSNASIQQISFRSRYNAIEPEETVIRLYENLAAGSGLDISLMGDFRNYEDERNFKTWELIYGFHKKYEVYFGKYASPAEICIISPAYWPGGESAQEYRGIQLMLKEAHLQYDIIEHEQIAALKQKIKKYKLIIIPQIPKLGEAAIATLKEACAKGTSLISTNQSFSENPAALLDLFGAKMEEIKEEGEGYYLNPENKDLFKRFEEQSLLFWKFNLGFYDLSQADQTYLSIYSPGRPGPPEKIGGHEPTGYYAVGAKKHGQGIATILPLNLGRLYYLHGYEQHKNILLDVIDHVFSQATDLLQSNAPERVELILQHFTKNLGENADKSNDQSGMILHLINLTGFSGNSYFKALPVYHIDLRIKCAFKPRSIYSMVTEREVPFTWEQGQLDFQVDRLDDFDGIIIEK